LTPIALEASAGTVQTANASMASGTAENPSHLTMGSMPTPPNLVVARRRILSVATRPPEPTIDSLARIAAAGA
jgi:hypothetical protein